MSDPKVKAEPNVYSDGVHETEDTVPVVWRLDLDDRHQ
jgi:hypothetical protein